MNRKAKMRGNESRPSRLEKNKPAVGAVSPSAKVRFAVVC